MLQFSSFKRGNDWKATWTFYRVNICNFYCNYLRTLLVLYCNSISVQRCNFLIRFEHGSCFLSPSVWLHSERSHSRWVFLFCVCPQRTKEATHSARSFCSKQWLMINTFKGSLPFGLHLSHNTSSSRKNYWWPVYRRYFSSFKTTFPDCEEWMLIMVDVSC